MSITLTVSVIPETRRFAATFIDIVDRMAMFSSGKALYLYENDSRPECRRSIDGADATDVSRLVADTVDSKNCLVVRMAYDGVAGSPNAIGVYLYGRGFDGGLPRYDSGPISVKMSVSEVGQRLWESVGEEWHIGPIMREEEQFTNVCQRLFHTVCGLPLAEGQLGSVRHCAMYLEYGWPSAVGCSMIYHYRLQDFVTDMARIVDEFQVGVSIPSLLMECDDISLGTSVKRVPSREKLELYRAYAVEESGALATFIRQLDKATVESFLHLSDAHLQEWFQHADLRQYRIKRNDFGCGLITLTTNPLLSLWPAYRLLYMSMKNSKSAY
jgi:hypothetical protein